MIAATGYELLKTLHRPQHVGRRPPEAITPLVMTRHSWVVLVIGLVVSFIVALGVVEWFLQWVRRHGFACYLLLYRIVLGIAAAVFGARLAQSGVRHRTVATPRFPWQRFSPKFPPAERHLG